MSIIETVQHLSTNLRKQEEEYENTSDFLEWFYHNVYRNEDFTFYPILYQIKKDSGYENMKNECRKLININYTKNIDNEFLVNSHNNLKQLLLDTLYKYGQV